jgi:hypothetical protein
LRLNKHFNYLNPSVNKLSEVLTSFKQSRRLQHIHLFVSSSRGRQLIKPSSGQNLFKSVLDLDQLDKDMTLLISARNDLVVFKCRFRQLEEILCKYGQIRDANYPFRLARGTHFERALVWIPTDKLQINRQLTCDNHSFRVYRMSFRFDVDKCLSSLIDHFVVNENGSGAGQAWLDWGGEFHLQDLKSGDKGRVSEASNYLLEGKSVKKSFRVVLKHVEPFLIVSSYFEADRVLDEGTGKCKDGLQCLEVFDVGFDEKPKRKSEFLNRTQLRHEFRSLFKKGEMKFIFLFVIIYCNLPRF